MRVYQIIIFLFAVSCLFLVESCNSSEQGNIDLIEKHFKRIITDGTDRYGIQDSPVWMSSIDPVTGAYPLDDQRPSHIPSRVYLDRSVDAPRGATLYWDLPAIVMAIELSAFTNNDLYKNAAREYIDFVLSNNVADNGIILWGNHYFYQAFDDQCVRFKSNETPQAIDFTSERGDLHEMRPHAPPWEVLWNIDSITTKRHITAAISGHLVDMETGEFNRHSDGKRGYAFLECGGILAYSLAWLYTKTRDLSLLSQANNIIAFSYGFRNSDTGLIENSPTQDRWDKYTSTTEIGLWGNYILKAAALAPDGYRSNWVQIVDDAVSSWLKYGYDEEKKMYYGGLQVANGKPFIPDPDYPYRPDDYADIWNPLFPTHNYPMQMAECCLSLYQLTGNELYRNDCEQWIKHIQKQTENSRNNEVLYAENYARILHYLMRYQELIGNEDVTVLIDKLVKESIDTLYLEKYGMFRSHTGEIRYDAVDGLGLLSLVILWYETGDKSIYNKYFF